MSTPRPDFEPATAEEVVARPRRGILPWLRLMRLPNVFTAVADVAMGYLFVRGTNVEPPRLALLIAASASLYTAGMVLNDWFDVEIDRRERPFRPVPSGQISLRAAAWLGFALLAIGLVLACLAGFAFPGVMAPARSGIIGIALASAIVAYDGWLKNTPLGPLAMGTCRFLNVLLGMSVGPPALDSVILSYGPGELLAAAGIGIYIVGVTWFARSEAQTSRRGQLVAAMGVMAAGVVALAASSRYVPLRIEPTMYWLLLALLMFSVLRRCTVAAIDPAPEKVQAAVKHSILSLIWLDAATAIAVASPLAGIAIAALLIPALVLGHWVYST